MFGYFITEPCLLFSSVHLGAVSPYAMWAVVSFPISVNCVFFQTAGCFHGFHHEVFPSRSRRQREPVFNPPVPTMKTWWGFLVETGPLFSISWWHIFDGRKNHHHAHACTLSTMCHLMACPLTRSWVGSSSLTLSRVKRGPQFIVGGSFSLFLRDC